MANYLRVAIIANKTRALIVCLMRITPISLGGKLKKFLVNILIMRHGSWSFKQWANADLQVVSADQFSKHIKSTKVFFFGYLEKQLTYLERQNLWKKVKNGILFGYAIKKYSKKGLCVRCQESPESSSQATLLLLLKLIWRG